MFEPEEESRLHLAPSLAVEVLKIVGMLADAEESVNGVAVVVTAVLLRVDVVVSAFVVVDLPFGKGDASIENASK